MNFITFLTALLAFHLSQVSSVTINCKFGNNTLGYGCTSFDQFKENELVTAVGGRHLRKFNNALVAYFWIPPKAKTIFVPLRLCNQFRGLKKFVIQGNSIETINRQVFEDCNKLDLLWISGTKIDWFAEDSFDDLVGLESIYLNDNKLKFLPAKLLDKNQLVHTFQATGNRLEVIELQFAKSVNFVNLASNVCVAQNVNGSTEVSVLNKFLDENCASSKQKSLKAEVENLRENLKKAEALKLLAIEKKFVELNGTVETLMKEKVLQRIEIEQLQKENEYYQQQISAFSTSVVHLKQQLEYHEKVKIEAQKSAADLEKEKLELTQSLISHQQAVSEMNDTSSIQKQLIDNLMGDILELTQIDKERVTNLQNLNVSYLELQQENEWFQEILKNETAEDFEQQILLNELSGNLTSCLEEKSVLTHETNNQNSKIKQLQEKNAEYGEQIAAFLSSVVSYEEQLEYHEKFKIDAQKSIVDIEKEKLDLNQTLIIHQKAVNEMNETSKMQKQLIDELMGNIFDLTLRVEERDSQLQDLTRSYLELLDENIKFSMITTTENPEENLSVLVDELNTNLTLCLGRVYELEVVALRNIDESATAIMQTTIVTQPNDDINVVTSQATRFAQKATEFESFDDTTSTGAILTAISSNENERNDEDKGSTYDDSDEYDDEPIVSTTSFHTQQANDELCMNSTIVSYLQKQLTNMRKNFKNGDENSSIIESSEVNIVKVRELESKVNDMEKLSFVLAAVLVAAIITVTALSLKLCSNRQKFSTRSIGMELTSGEKYRQSSSTAVNSN